MSASAIPLALALALLAAPLSGSAGSHYLPKAGDAFSYQETIALTDGVGNYTGYTETTAITGSESVTAVAPNGTASATYQYRADWSDNSGDTNQSSSSGPYTFSAQTFRYVQGTDDQTGYSHPFVWFYMNNSLPLGGTFYLLDSELSVVSDNTSYLLGTSPGRYVATIFSEGNGSFERNDEYGVFTATYNWRAYFDPATGFIVGYLYTEHDSDGAGDGFTWTDTLFVTNTSYALTPGAAPPPGSASGPIGTALLVGLVVLVVVVIAVVAVVVALARRRSRLPAHSPTGAASYRPPTGMAPPPIRLGAPDQPAVQQIVLRDTVKVNCRFCGTLIDSTLDRCPNCGAPRT
ncbi:MAG TPA: hypothetical protein VLY85_00830 [Thermoplasmata archaeon]|nr:hypothetical protein [Thermoplasmata archaeon]